MASCNNNNNNNIIFQALYSMYTLYTIHITSMRQLSYLLCTAGYLHRGMRDGRPRLIIVHEQLCSDLHHSIADAVSKL